MFNRRYKNDEYIRENFINLRPFAFASIALAMGATFCYAALFHGISLLFSLFSLFPCLLYVIFSRKKARAIVCFFLFLTFLGIGMGGFALRIEEYQKQNLKDGNYLLTGEIADFTAGENYSRILLKNATANGEALDGNITVSLYVPSAQGQEGMKIRFNASVQRVGNPYRYNTFHADMVLSNIKYTATASSDPVIFGNTQNLFSAVRKRIKEALYGNFSEEQAGLAYALTTGNTEGIEEGLLSSVRYGGVAHLFAVSGLHIGIIYAAFVFLCKRCHAPALIGVFIPLVAAFLFSGVCGFSPSSLRAFLVCFALSAASYIGVRADGSESAGFACGIILLLNPVYLFSVGFQLSAAAYIGIAVLSPNIRKLLSPVCVRFPVLKKSVGTLAVMLSVQLCLFPIMLNAFGYVSVWGFLLNPIILPLFSLYFSVLFSGVLLSCVFPAAAFVFLFLPAAVLLPFAAFFYAIDFSGLLINGFSLGMVAMFAFYMLLLFFSGKINIPNGEFTPIACFLAAVILFDVLNVARPTDDCRITQMCYYNGFCCVLIQTEESDILVVNGMANISRLQTFLSRCMSEPDVVVIVSENVNGCAGALLAVPALKFYVRRGESLELRTRSVVAADTFSEGGVYFRFRYGNTLTFTFQNVTGVFNGTGYNADFTVFPAEERDGLIFKINRGILSVDR